MSEQVVKLMLDCDERGIAGLRQLSSHSLDHALTTAVEFLRRSSEGGRHIWGGFRNKVVQLLFNLAGQARGEDLLLSEWDAFPEESRLDLVYDVVGDPQSVSTEFVSQLFFHSASSVQCKGSIIAGLLESSKSRRLNDAFFYQLLDQLSAQVSPYGCDHLDLFCISMCELISAHFASA